MIDCSRPTISVLMSVYNETPEWIQQSIDSILNQSFGDFEFIIINDNPDDTQLREFLECYALKDTRIRVLTNSENIGLTKSLNKGLRLCKGRYIARMDADDISLPERFRLQHDFLNNNPQIGVCGTLVEKIDKNNKKIGRIKLFCSSKDLRDSVYFFSPFVHPTVMIRKEIMEQFEYDENCRIAQDWNLWLRLSKKYSFANIDSVLLYYRIHSCQSMKKAGASRSNASRAYSDALFANELGLNDDQKSLFIKYRGGAEITDDQLRQLFRNIIEKRSLRDIRYYAMRIYIKKRLDKSIKSLLTDQLIWSHPYITFKGINIELKRK